MLVLEGVGSLCEGDEGGWHVARKETGDSRLGKLGRRQVQGAGVVRNLVFEISSGKNATGQACVS